MTILPRHVLCILGQWSDFRPVERVLQSFPAFRLDMEYSQLMPDERMTSAFEASYDRINPSMKDKDWEAIESHSAVAYILSPPMVSDQAIAISALALALVSNLLQTGAVAAKSDSAGMAHGCDKWNSLADVAERPTSLLSTEDEDAYLARAALCWAWVRRILHDKDDSVFYSCGMHLLGLPDTEISSALPPLEAAEWIDTMHLYLVAEQPTRPVFDGQGFRMANDGPRKIIRHTPCHRYEQDDFFFNPYGYYRLAEVDA